MSLNKKLLIAEIYENYPHLQLTKKEVSAMADFVIAMGKARYKKNIQWKRIEELIKFADTFIDEVGV